MDQSYNVLLIGCCNFSKTLATYVHYFAWNFIQSILFSSKPKQYNCIILLLKIFFKRKLKPNHPSRGIVIQISLNLIDIRILNLSSFCMKKKTLALLNPSIVDHPHCLSLFNNSKKKKKISRAKTPKMPLSYSATSIFSSKSHTFL
jgi:hypothetical protein